MAQIREIKKRIKAVGNIRRITNTMQMIATARFKAAQDKATQTKPYTDKVRHLVQELAANAGDVEHPLFHPPAEPAGKELLLVLTSQRGLCGAFNSNVLRKAMHYLNGLENESTLEVVGKKGIAFFNFAGVTIDHRHDQFGDDPTFAEVEPLAQRYMDEFNEGRYDRVSVAYMRFFSAGKQRPVIEQLLPLEKPAGLGDEDENGGGAGASAAAKEGAGPSGNVEYEFSPDAESLLADLLPITVKTALYQAFRDAVVSEHVARMVAMKAATDNAGKLNKSLRRTYNRARQAQITTELTEIVGGAAALG